MGFSGEPVVNGTRLQHTLAVLNGSGAIEIAASGGPVQVLLGTAAKHPWDLVLVQGMATIRAIGAELKRGGI